MQEKCAEGPRAGTWMECAGNGVGGGSYGVRQCESGRDECVKQDDYYAQCRPKSERTPEGWSGNILSCSGESACSFGDDGACHNESSKGHTQLLCRAVVSSADSRVRAPVVQLDLPCDAEREYRPIDTVRKRSDVQELPILTGNLRNARTIARLAVSTLTTRVLATASMESLDAEGSKTSA